MAKLPAYEPMLAAYHRAFAAELQGMIDSLPISTSDSVLDMACGDGAYSRWFAERARRVTAVDANREYVERAKAEIADVEFLCATLEDLPFDENTFDVSWCAQSLYSLPDPVEALKRMARVTKPGGIIAVLENDSLHHVILPWPVEIEFSVRAVELQRFAEKNRALTKFYIGRQLKSVFREAGIAETEVRTFAHNRAAPLNEDETTFFTEYLKGLSQKYGEDLDEPIRRAFKSMTNPRSKSFLLNDPDLTITCLDCLAWGRVAS